MNGAATAGGGSGAERAGAVGHVDDIDRVLASERMGSRGQWRLLGPAVLGWGAAASLIHMPGAANVAALAVGVLGAVLCLAAPQVAVLHGATRLFGALLLCCAALLLVCMRVGSIEAARDAAALVAADASGAAVEARAVLGEYPEASHARGGNDGRGGNGWQDRAGRAWVRAEIERLGDVELPQPVFAMLWLPESPPDSWAPGTPVELRGRFSRSPPASRTAYEVSVQRIEEASLSSGASSWIARAGRLAADLRAQLRSSAADAPGARLVPGLAVGDTSLIDEELETIMLESSLTHLVAVSGSNCALVISAAIACSALLGAGRRLRILLAAAALGGFVIVVGPDASVQRASVMAAVLLVSNFGGRRRQALPALGLAMLVLLVADPWQSMQAGFALSVAATAGILLWAPACEAWLRRLRIPRVLALPLSVSCVAQAACGPLLLLLQPGLPVAGVLANLLAAPAAPLGTALGLAAAVLLQLHEPLGETALRLAAWPARWIEASGTLSAALPAARWYWPGGAGGALLLAAVGILLLIALSLARSRGARRGIWGEASRDAGIRAGSRSGPLLAAISGTAAGLLIAVVLVVPIAVKLGVPRDWAVVACDIGQGDALLLRDPRHPDAVMLIDTGDDPAKLEICLELFGVEDIELLVLTHDDRDHVGALSSVVGRSEAALISPYGDPAEKPRGVVEELRGAGVPAATARPGMRGGGAEGLSWEVLGPPERSSHRSTNAASVVLLVEVRGMRVLLLGDTGEEEQRRLVRDHPGLEADVVKVSHHGSRDQFADLYQELGAEVALVSVGENRYGHPNPELMTMLSQSGAAVLRTDRLGSVALRVRDGVVEPWAAGERSTVSTVR